MSRKNPRRPKRLFREPRLSAEALQLIEGLTQHDPELGRVLTTTASALMDPEYVRAYYEATLADRGGLLLAWRNASFDVVRGKSCDLCEVRARTVRFVAVLSQQEFDKAGVVPPSESRGLMGFAVVCERCVRLPSAELRLKWLSQIGPCRREDGQPSGLRPTLIGHRIGEGGELPRRHGLEECCECHETIWVDRDEEEALGKPALVCRRCAERFAAGEVPGRTLDLVPIPWILLP